MTDNFDNNNPNEEQNTVRQNLLLPKQPDIDNKSLAPSQSTVGKFAYNGK